MASDMDRLGDVDPFTWMLSTLGDVCASGISMQQLKNATHMAETQLQFDCAIAAADQINNIVKTHKRR